jgi:hypothetical protein
MSVRTQIRALSSFLPLVMQKLKTKLQKMITCHGICKTWLQKIAAHEQMRHNWCIWPTWNLSITNWSILMQFAEKSPLKYFEGQSNKCHVSSWVTENKQQTSNGCCQTLVSVTQKLPDWHLLHLKWQWLPAIWLLNHWLHQLFQHQT